jgi:hypothetical protein
MSNRTLREIQTLRDRSNETLRFSRTMQEAGMRGGIEEDPGSGGGIWLWAVAGAMVLWLVLTLILGWTA